MSAAQAPLLYLVSRYPMVSQTFIRREVEALRALGMTVLTASLHRTPEVAVLGRADRVAAETTTALLPPSRRALLAAVLSVLAAPAAHLRVLVGAVREARGLRRRAWQCFYFAEALLLREHCRRVGARHVHVHFTNNAVDAARLAVAVTKASKDATGPSTYSFTVHGPTEFFDVTRFGLVDKVADASYVVCISDFARSQVMAHVPVHDWEKLAVVRCGVDPDAYAVPNAGEPAEPRILCVGRLVPEKGQRLLVEALGLLRAEGLAFTADLVGDGPGRRDLSELVRRTGLEDVVRLPGALSAEEVTELYARSSLFCLPSFAEGVPIVLMEAMASQLPVVTTAVAGIPELVLDGTSGVVVPPGDVGALAGALRTLLTQPDLRSELGQHGRAAVQRRYDLRRNAATLARLHAHAVGSPPPAAEPLESGAGEQLGGEG